MKRDIKLYNYHTDCPNCEGFNTRLNSPLNMEYAICYSCSLIFKPEDSEIEKMRTPYPIDIAIHKDLANISNQQMDYIKKIYEINTKAKSGDLNLLNKDIEAATDHILNGGQYNNIVIFSNFGVERKIAKTTIITETEIKQIEKILYTKVLKNGKIDCIIFENVSNLILSKILGNIQQALTSDCLAVAYAPIVDDIYNNFISYIRGNKYFYNIYTIFREFNRINFNIFELKKLNYFNQLILKFGSNEDVSFNKLLETISQKDHRNIMYSEPLTIIE